MARCRSSHRSVAAAAPELADADGIVGIGADLEPGTLLAAYRSGLFPMPLGRRNIAWFSPDPRAIIPLDGLRVSRSLRRSMRRFEVRRDTRFGEVMVRCADPRRPGGWITPKLRQGLQAAAPARMGPLRRVLRRRRRSSSAASTACASAASSPASRCSTPPPTRPRSPSSPSSTGSTTTGATLLDVQWMTQPPRVARRRRDPPRRVPRAPRRGGPHWPRTHGEHAA